MKKVLLTAALALTTISTANAYQINIGDNSSIGGPAFDDANVGLGLVMEGNLRSFLGDLELQVDAGTTDSFVFASFWTEENWVNDNDLNPLNIEVKIDIEGVAPGSIVLEGSAVGTRGSLFNYPQGWEITWDAPVEFTLNGQLFSIELDDAFYTNWAPFGGPDGTFLDNYGKQEVWATITHKGIAPVPEPGTMLLLGVGLASIAGRMRKQK